LKFADISAVNDDRGLRRSHLGLFFKSKNPVPEEDTDVAFVELELEEVENNGPYEEVKLRANGPRCNGLDRTD